MMADLQHILSSFCGLTRRGFIPELYYSVVSQYIPISITILVAECVFREKTHSIIPYIWLDLCSVVCIDPAV